MTGPPVWPRNGKRRVVILGSGFASMNLLHDIDFKLYDVVVVSPRPYFLFTPLLDSWIFDKVGITSVIQPVRSFNQSVKLVQSECTSIDGASNTITCGPLAGGMSIRIPYDYLVIGTGSVPDTYGIPGVAENALMLKALPDAREIKRRIANQYTLASAHRLTEAERNFS